MFARALPEDARAFGHRLGSRVLDSRSSFGLQGSPLLWSRVELESAQIMANTAAHEQVACTSTGLSTVVDNGCVPSPLAQERIHRLRGGSAAAPISPWIVDPRPCNRKREGEASVKRKVTVGALGMGNPRRDVEKRRSAILPER